MKSLLEKGVPFKIIEKGDKFIVALNFEKPIGRKMLKLITDLLNLMEKDVSED